MRKTLKKLNSKGMTLVEIIIGLLVSSIIVTTATSLLFMSSNITNKTQNSNLAKIVGDSVLSFIDSQLLYSEKVEIKATASSSIGTNHIKVEGGHMLLNNEQIYGEDFYSGYHVEIAAQVLENNVVTVFVYVLDKLDNEVYKSEKSLKVLNVSIKNFNIATTSKITNPYIFFINSAIGKKDTINDMKGLFLDTFKKCVENGGRLPDDWKELGMTHGYVSNDTIREYIVRKHYGGKFPTLSPEEITRSSDLIKIAQGNILYVQAYIYPFSMTDTPTLTFYAKNTTVSDWYVALIFDVDENIWYTGPAISIANNSWAKNKATMIARGWRPVVYDK